MGPGLYNALYVAMDASRNEATCNFNIEVKGITRIFILKDIVYNIKRKQLLNKSNKYDSIEYNIIFTVRRSCCDGKPKNN